MPNTDATLFARPDKGGLIRDAKTIFSHAMPGAADPDLLQNALTLDVAAERRGLEVLARVNIVNSHTGHHVPSDSPLRHVILVVEAHTDSGERLSLLEGPTLPRWCGEGDPEGGCYAGRPGKVFAKVLADQWTRSFPTGAYWLPTRLVQDSRIPAFGSDESSFVFEASPGKEVTIDVNLIYRRAYFELMRQKGWTDPDIVMEHRRVKLVHTGGFVQR